MSNSESFLDTYNKIDDFLKKYDHHDSYVTFAHKLKHTSNKVAKIYKDELISFGELRNAIVHFPKIENKAIAEPHEQTVKRLNELFEKISNPIKVTPTFSLDTLDAKKHDFINDILIEMKDKSYSQFPVLNDNNHVIELINNNTISRWLSFQMEDNGTIMIENAKIEDLIAHIEFNKNYKFISKDSSIYQAYDMFINHINTKKRNLDVIFITNSGKEKEKLLGLITIEDIALKI